MPITVTVTFEAADAQELNELIALALDNEPTALYIDGNLSFDWSNQDDAPAHGIERPYWEAEQVRSEAFAKAAEGVQRRERELVTTILYDELVSVAREYRENNQGQNDFLHDVDYLALRVDSPQAMPNPPMPTMALSCMRDLRFHITDAREFEAVCHELGRDAWGSTCKASVL